MERERKQNLAKFSNFNRGVRIEFCCVSSQVLMNEYFITQGPAAVL